MKITGNDLNRATEGCDSTTQEVNAVSNEIHSHGEANVQEAIRLLKQATEKREALERNLGQAICVREIAMKAVEASLKKHQHCQEVGTGLINEAKNHEQIASALAAEASVYRARGNISEAENSERRLAQEKNLAAKYRCEGEKKLEEMALHAVQAEKNLGEVHDMDQKIAVCKDAVQQAKSKEKKSLDCLLAVKGSVANILKDSDAIKSVGIAKLCTLKDGLRAAIDLLKDYD